MKVTFNNFSREQLEILRNNIDEALLNDFRTYTLTIFVDDPPNLNAYEVQNIEGMSNTEIDLNVG